MSTFAKGFLVFLTGLYPAAHLGLSWRQANLAVWSSILGSDCKREDSVPLNGNPDGFGLASEACKRKCAEQSDCKVYTYSKCTEGWLPWVLGLSRRFGGHYGEMRCQLYQKCSVGKHRGIEMVQKPEPAEPLRELGIPILYLLQMSVNVLALINGIHILICVALSIALSSVFTASWSGMLTTLDVDMASMQNSRMLIVLYCFNILTLLVLWRCKGKPDAADADAASGAGEIVAPSKARSACFGESSASLSRKGSSDAADDNQSSSLFFAGTPVSSMTVAPPAPPPPTQTVILQPTFAVEAPPPPSGTMDLRLEQSVDGRLTGPSGLPPTETMDLRPTEAMYPTHLQPTATVASAAPPPPIETMDLRPVETMDGRSIGTDHVHHSETMDLLPAETVDGRPVGTYDLRPTETMDLRPTETMDLTHLQPTASAAPAAPPPPVGTFDLRPAETTDGRPIGTFDLRPSETMDLRPTETVDGRPIGTSDLRPTEMMDSRSIETLDLIHLRPTGTVQGAPPPVGTMDLRPTETMSWPPTETVEKTSLQPVGTLELPICTGYMQD